jgi:RNA polymerase-binding transcription factor DksA
MSDLAGRRRQLEDRILTLDVRLHDIEDELESHQSKDWEELASEREGDEVLESLGESGKAEIVRIRAALKRIEDGSYGTCATCGSEISQERLDLVPWTPFCKTCAP